MEGGEEGGGRGVVVVRENGMKRGRRQGADSRPHGTVCCTDFGKLL